MSASKPLPRRCSSVARIADAATVIWPLSRKYSVPRTEASSAARSSSARSSRPTASGTGGVPGTEHVDRRVGLRVGRDDLLGAARAVALAPAHVGVLLDHLAQLE